MQEDNYGLAKLRVLAPIEKVEDWSKLRNTLSDISVISNLRIVRIAPHWIDMELTSTQNDDELVSALAARNLKLTKEAEGWVVR